MPETINQQLIQRIENLEEGYQLLKQELRKRVNDIADLTEESPLGEAIQELQKAVKNLQSRMTALEKQVDILSGE